jgi:hypothetical protein
MGIKLGLTLEEQHRMKVFKRIFGAHWDVVVED